MTDARLTHDEALMILNDRCGGAVEIAVEANWGLSHTPAAVVVTANGTLKHWRKPGVWDLYAREDIVGMYEVGDTTIDVTHIIRARHAVCDGLISTAGMVVGDSLPDDAHRIYGIEFMLDEATMLSVVWGLKGRGDA